MSRQEAVNAPGADSDPGLGSNDAHLDIDLRLGLAEVAEAEAEQLLKRARHQPTKKQLCRLACRIYDARRTRDRMLDKQLFGEPAWDMLLALYCLPARGERLGVTALSHAADVPQSTGHRWQAILTKEGLIERGPKELDARLQMMRLTETGRKLL